VPAAKRQRLDFRGDLQNEVMTTMWRLGEATVEEVRREQPGKRGSAYTTLQTVMNRLVERGVLDRERRGSAYVYRPRYAEADYVSQTISERLASASPPARRAALVNLVGSLEPGELDEISRYANRVRRARGKEEG
jgi:predicted transcriptional regulator